jgi:hypothetical protein
MTGKVAIAGAAAYGLKKALAATPTSGLRRAS